MARKIETEWSKPVVKSVCYILVTLILFNGRITKPIGSIMLSVLIADFLTGIFHWIEDTYFSEDTPLIGRIIQLNRLHHDDPMDMCKTPWYRSIKETTSLSMAIALLVHPLFANKLLVISTATLTSLSNLIHKWNHLPQRKVNPVYRKYLQGVIFQGNKSHKIHHDNPMRDYFILSEFLNPVAEAVGFWRNLEDSIETVTGVPPRLHELN